MNCVCIAKKIVGVLLFPCYTSAQEILRSIANFLDECVEEVFQGIARIAPISSVILDRMAGLLSDIYIRRCEGENFRVIRLY